MSTANSKRTLMPHSCRHVSSLQSVADLESRAWVQRLSADGPVREEALRDLRELLLRAARFEINRRSRTLPHFRGGDLDDLALESADDALVAVLSKLDDFHGESRFTTWAYKFALLEAAVTVRRLAWQGRELPVEPELWALVADGNPTAHQKAETRELLVALEQAIQDDLSAHQRAGSNLEPSASMHPCAEHTHSKTGDRPRRLAYPTNERQPS